MNRDEKRRSELESLLVDAEEADTDRILREALGGRIAIDRNSGRVLPRQGLMGLSQSQRLVVLLLARHVLKRLGIGSGVLEADAGELANEGQIPLQTTRELLSRLKKQGIFAKGAAGYLVPDWNVLLAAEKLKTGQENPS
jgi:hypothetical protein